MLPNVTTSISRVLVINSHARMSTAAFVVVVTIQYFIAPHRSRAICPLNPFAPKIHTASCMDSQVFVHKPTMQTSITRDIPTLTPHAQPRDHDSATPNLWRLGITPINVYALNRYLVHYPNKIVANKLIQGFSQGFKLHYHGPRLPTQCNNLKSADDHPQGT